MDCYLQGTSTVYAQEACCPSSSTWVVAQTVMVLVG